MAADLASRCVELLGQERVGLAEAPRDATDGFPQLLAELRRSRRLFAGRAQELLGFSACCALDLAALAAALGHSAIVRGLRVGKLALRLAARALQDPPRLLVGVLAKLRCRGKRRLLALVDERVGPRLGALERILGVRSPPRPAPPRAPPPAPPPRRPPRPAPPPPGGAAARSRSACASPRSTLTSS